MRINKKLHKWNVMGVGTGMFLLVALDPFSCDHVKVWVAIDRVRTACVKASFSRNWPWPFHLFVFQHKLRHEHSHIQKHKLILYKINTRMLFKMLLSDSYFHVILKCSTVVFLSCSVSEERSPVQKMSQYMQQQVTYKLDKCQS